MKNDDLKYLLEEYDKIINRSNYLKEIAKQGAVNLDLEIDIEKVKNKDVLEYGLKLLFEPGFSSELKEKIIICKILNTLVMQENDPLKRMLKHLQRVLVFDIWNNTIIDKDFIKEKYTIDSLDTYLEIPGILEINEKDPISEEFRKSFDESFDAIFGRDKDGGENGEK